MGGRLKRRAVAARCASQKRGLGNRACLSNFRGFGPQIEGPCGDVKALSGRNSQQSALETSSKINKKFRRLKRMAAAFFMAVAFLGGFSSVEPKTEGPCVYISKKHFLGKFGHRWKGKTGGREIKVKEDPEVSTPAA